MKRIVLLLVMAVVVLFQAPAASAGGWAVGTFDPLPALQAGQRVAVGFELLQHGKTPVVAASWEGATIGVAVRDGANEWFVEAVATGGPGHYVASIDVPATAATLELGVRMPGGLFVDETWVSLPVGEAGALAADAAGTTTGGSEGWLPTWAIPVGAVAAAVCAGVVLVELRGDRRRAQVNTAP